MTTLPADIVEDVLARNESNVYLHLLQFHHRGQGSLNVVNNTQPITSNGLTYEPLPFNVVEAHQDVDELPTMVITIQDPTGQIVERVRRTAGSRDDATVRHMWINAGQPDTILRQSSAFIISDRNYDASTITIRATLRNFLTAKWPYLTFNRTDFPQLFERT